MMINSIAELRPLLPEIVILVSGLFLMMFDAFTGAKQRGWMYLLASIALLVAAYCVTLDMRFGAPDRSLNGLFVRDALGDVLKLFMLLATGLVFVYGRHYFDAKRQYFGNFYVLILFALLGMMVLVSAGNLVTIYLGLELMALATYAIVALDRDNGVATESAMKYFVLGALASGILLYGMSLLFALTGALDLYQINSTLLSLYEGGGTAQTGNLMMMSFALAFIVIGLAFKFGAVPFHMWLPDVYEGAPTAMTAFIASVPKLAAVGMAIRLLPDGLAYEQMTARWQEMLALLAMGSLIVGNLGAIAQYNLKRMLAYSTISHVGFMLLALMNAQALGLSALLFYVIVYSLSSAAAFGVIICLSRSGLEFDRIADFKGLNQRSPWLAAVMLVVMASLAGIPPLIGFWAKLQVLMAALAMGPQWQLLVFIAAVFAVIGSFYYLRVIKVMYFDAPETDAMPTKALDVRVILLANTALLVVLGLYAQPLAQLCQRVFTP
jgi:NADH-quinone oxidoreductase subunit N